MGAGRRFALQLDLFAQLPLGADPVAITDDKHPDHQLRINRWPPEFAVEGLKLAAKIRQYARHCRIDPAQQMARWNPPLEIKQVKELALIARLSPHQAESSVLVSSQHRIIVSRGLPVGFSTVSAITGHIFFEGENCELQKFTPEKQSWRPFSELHLVHSTCENG
jgi:hypothetical protein